MTLPNRHKRSNRRGTANVEFAIMLLLMMILLETIEFGRTLRNA